MEDKTEKQAKLNFEAEHHKSLINNLNKISDDLLRTKWFFLATLGSLGIAYTKIYKEEYKDIQECGFFLICLIGNIIFWLLSEYAVSHAFLFRFIQGQMAKIEKRFKENAYNIKDPTDKKMFIKNNRLEIDYIMPDQFLPIYWASIWLMVINTIIAILLMRTLNKDYLSLSVKYSLICLPFIWKLWTYYVYKIRKFITENCNFRVLIKSNNNDFLDFPVFDIFLIDILCTYFYSFYLFLYKYLNFLDIFLFAIANFFWPVIIGLLIHILKIILRLNLRKIFAPNVSKENYNYIVDQGSFYRILIILYNIV